MADVYTVSINERSFESRFKLAFSNASKDQSVSAISAYQKVSEELPWHTHACPESLAIAMYLTYHRGASEEHIVIEESEKLEYPNSGKYKTFDRGLALELIHRVFVKSKFKKDLNLVLVDIARYYERLIVKS